MATLKLDKAEAKKQFKSTPEWFRQVLINAFGAGTFSEKITDRLKTYEDFYNETTEKAKPVFDFRTIKSFEDACYKLNMLATLPGITGLEDVHAKDIIARYKLEIVYLAINDGWMPVKNGKLQPRYEVYHYLLSSGSGFDFSHSVYGYTYANADAGLRLCTHSEEKSNYIKDQFDDLWKDMKL